MAKRPPVIPEHVRAELRRRRQGSQGSVEGRVSNYAPQYEGIVVLLIWTIPGALHAAYGSTKRALLIWGAVAVHFSLTGHLSLATLGTYLLLSIFDFFFWCWYTDWKRKHTTL